MCQRNARKNITVTVSVRVSVSQNMACIALYASAAMLDFKNFKFLTVEKVKTVEVHYCAKFHQNRLNCVRDIVIFLFFRMVAAAILDFQNLKFLTFGTVKRVELRNRAKFCQNRSNRGRYMVIFRFFKMAAVAILDF